MAIIDQFKKSTFGLFGRHKVEPFRDPTAHSSFWGFRDPSLLTDPYLSQLHGEGFANPYSDGYSVDGTPSPMKLINFGDSAAGSTITLRKPSSIDELDVNAPQNTQVGPPKPNGGSVVSQIYKSATGRKYKDLGPKDGRY